MAFVGRVLLNRVVHVPKARVLSAAFRLHKLPTFTVAQAHMTTGTAAGLHEGQHNLTDSVTDYVLVWELVIMEPMYIASKHSL